jgi:exodeoxyribonuclease V alpha subunit
MRKTAGEKDKEKDLIKKSGYLSVVRYFNKDNSFLIGRFNDAESEVMPEMRFMGCVCEFSAKGTLYLPAIGNLYHLYGKWITDKKYGNTFVFEYYETEMPKTPDAIKTYLLRNCDGIGYKYAEILVSIFGENTLEVLKNSPEDVKHQASIPYGVLLEASKVLKDKSREETFNIALNTLFKDAGIGKRKTKSILNTFGKQTVEQIKADPYILTGVKGISFLIADKVASNVGVGKDDPKRVRACIKHVLKEHSLRGHSSCKTGILLGKIQDLTGADLNVIKEIIIREQGFDVMKNTGEDTYALTELYECEEYIANKIKEIQTYEALNIGTGCSCYVEDLQEDQKEALFKILNHSISILTGAPGTGKTFLIKKIMALLKDSGIYNIELAAPTGKAAKRMYEQTGCPAQTIHKLLEPQLDIESGKFIFTRNSSYPLDAEVLIIDESSMIDIKLMYSLLKAIQPNTVVIFIGDNYQLPPVGAGNVFHDMINSNIVPYVELTSIKRQDPGLIITNCHAIKDGKNIKSSRALSSDFIMCPKQGSEAIQKEIFRVVTEAVPHRFSLFGEKIDPVWDVQVITPYNTQTILSCEALNEKFQAFFNKNDFIEKTDFKVGDKVIQVKNNYEDYEESVINGDIGKVIGFEMKYSKSVGMTEPYLKVEFFNPSREVTIPAFENDLKLAYAITCHKFQGSEEKVVVIPVCSSFSPQMMQRNWLYTAVSRAVRLCVIVGELNLLDKIIGRNQAINRETNLYGFLREGVKVIEINKEEGRVGLEEKEEDGYISIRRNENEL